MFFVSEAGSRIPEKNTVTMWTAMGDYGCTNVHRLLTDLYSDWAFSQST